MSLSCSYFPNYFSIEDILATQERMPCKFLINVPKLGKLNLSNEDDDLKPGTALELPVWLVNQLTSGRQPVVSADLPKVYRETYREILQADACAVNLHKFGVYFYELGAHVKYLDIRGDLSKTLLQTFQQRFRKLMDLVENASSDPTVQNSLDNLEKQLFQDGHASRMRLNNWLMETTATLEAATMVVNHKKRKRIELEELF